jgi:hypothetical protein
MKFPWRSQHAQKVKRILLAIFLHDKIVQIVTRQAKYPRYCRMLAGWIRPNKNNSAREQLFPLRVKNFELALDDLFKQIIAMLLGQRPRRRRNSSCRSCSISGNRYRPQAGFLDAKFLPGSSAKDGNFTEANSLTPY